MEGGAESVVLVDMAAEATGAVVMEGEVAREVEVVEATVMVVVLLVSVTIVGELVIWLGTAINKAASSSAADLGDTAVAVVTPLAVAVAVVVEGVIIVERKGILRGTAQTFRVWVSGLSKLIGLYILLGFLFSFSSICSVFGCLEIVDGMRSDDESEAAFLVANCFWLLGFLWLSSLDFVNLVDCSPLHYRFTLLLGVLLIVS